MSVAGVSTSRASEISSILIGMVGDIDVLEGHLEKTVRRCFQALKVVKDNERTIKELEEKSSRIGFGLSVEVLQAQGELVGNLRNVWTQQIASLEELNESFQLTVNALSRIRTLTNTDPAFETVRNAILLRAFVAQSFAHFCISVLRL